MIDDVYDLAVARLTRSPELIYAAWNQPSKNIGGILFRNAGAPLLDGFHVSSSSVGVCGCLTQIKNDPDTYKVIVNNYRRNDVLLEIARDARIPQRGKHITVEDLPVFAEWQRRFDVMFEREPPKEI